MKTIVKLKFKIMFRFAITAIIAKFTDNYLQYFINHKSIYSINLLIKIIIQDIILSYLHFTILIHFITFIHI